MLQLTALAVSAVASACQQRALLPGEAVEVTWRHYRSDPQNVWFLEVHVFQQNGVTERATLVAL
jgi:hypothetical protein